MNKKLYITNQFIIYFKKKNENAINMEKKTKLNLHSARYNIPTEILLLRVLAAFTSTTFLILCNLESLNFSTVFCYQEIQKFLGYELPIDLSIFQTLIYLVLFLVLFKIIKLLYYLVQDKDLRNFKNEDPYRTLKGVLIFLILMCVLISLFCLIF